MFSWSSMTWYVLNTFWNTVCDKSRYLRLPVTNEIFLGVCCLRGPKSFLYQNGQVFFYRLPGIKYSTAFYAKCDPHATTNT